MDSHDNTPEHNPEPNGTDLPAPKSGDVGSPFPALKHRPARAVKPVPTKTLSIVRSALLRNPDVNLPAAAAGIITSGLTDPRRFRQLTEAQDHPNGEKSSLLNTKRVGEGTVFVTAQHDRFIDLGILPDPIGARWMHTLRTQLDPETGELPAASITTATGPDGPWAMLELEVDDHHELAARVREAFAKTGPDNSSAGNDYTDSILQSGVKEPLLLVPMRVQFRDGSDDEYYLVSIDGNSRLVSMWKGRTGGTVDQAASACIETVIGTAVGKAWKRATQRHTREALANQVDLINNGLQEEQLTESTIRLGHTLTAPSVVVIGGRITDSAEPLTDLVAAREDLIATIHTDTTPWDQVAQAEQGMVRLLRRAVQRKLITQDERDVIEGRCTPQQMHDLLGLPPHRLWAAALTIQVVLNPWYDGMGALFREEFNCKKPSRLTIGKRIASTALSGYRSWPSLGMAINAFSDGGPIAEPIWGYKWYLTRGTNPVQVLDAILQTALTGKNIKKIRAVAELCALGGTAGMLTGLITRDRGSKESEDGKRTPGKVPFRARPYRLIDELAATAGGLRTLHSMAVAHVTGKPAKRFHSADDPELDVVDGDPFIDAADVHASLEYEWDVVVVANTRRAREAIAAITNTGSGNSTKPEAVQLRENLQNAAATVEKSVKKLVALKSAMGTDVFGSYDMIELIKGQLQKARDTLNVHGPAEPFIIDDIDDDDDDHLDGDDEELDE